LGDCSGLGKVIMCLWVWVGVGGMEVSWDHRGMITNMRWVRLYTFRRWGMDGQGKGRRASYPDLHELGYLDLCLHQERQDT